MTWDFSVDGPTKLTFDWLATQRAAGARVAPEVTEALRRAAPRSRTKPDAGRLADAFGWRQESFGEGGLGTYLLMFLNTAPYARYVLHGTKAGAIITPKKAMALRWTTGTTTHFAALVHRGATRANNFNQRVAIEMSPFILETFKHAVVITAE